MIKEAGKRRGEGESNPSCPLPRKKKSSSHSVPCRQIKRREIAVCKTGPQKEEEDGMKSPPFQRWCTKAASGERSVSLRERRAEAKYYRQLRLSQFLFSVP